MCVGVKSSVCVFLAIMWSEMHQVVSKYVQLLQAKSYVPPFSYGRGLLRDDGGPNRLFFMYLFGDEALAITFLQELLRDDGGPNRLFFTYLTLPHGHYSCAQSALIGLRAKLVIFVGASLNILMTWTYVNPTDIIAARIADCERSSLSFWALH